MRTIRLILISCLLIAVRVGTIQAQVTDLNTAKARIQTILSDLKALDQNIQQEMDQVINTELDTRPKGEFETTTEYDERLKQNETKRQELAQKFAEQKNERQSTLEQELDLIIGKAYPAPVSIDLGLYRPDLQRFPFTVPQYKKKGSLLMPIAIAPEFKTGFATLSPIGYFQFSRDGEQRLIYVRVNFKDQSFTARTDRRMQAVNNLATLTGHSRPVNVVAFSNDGNLLASGSDDRSVKIWDVKKQSLLYNLAGHTKYVTCLAFHPFDQILASGADDGQIIIWQIDGQKPLLKINAGPDGVKRLSFSPDGKLIAGALPDYSINIWQTSDGQLLQTLTGHTDEIKGIAFSPDGLHLASTGFDQSLKLWNVKDGVLIKSQEKAHLLWINTLAFSPDGELLATGGDDKTLNLWNAHDLTRQRSMADFTSPVNSVVFSYPDGLTLACGMYDNNLVFKRAEDGLTIKTLKAHGNSLKSISYDFNGKLLASASDDKTVKLWEIVYDELAELAGDADGRLLSNAGSGLPPKLQAEVSFTEPSGNNYLDANETGILKISVTNTGQGTGYNVTAALSGNNLNDLDFSPRTQIGDVAKGETKSVEIPLKARYKIPADTVQLNCNILEANGFNLNPMQIQFETRPYFVKLVKVGIQVADQSGNGMIEPEEIVDVTVRIQNQGTSLARDVRAALRIDQNVFFIGKDTKERVQQFTLGDLAGGEYKDITVKIYTNNVATEVPAFLTMSEYYREWGAVNIPLDLAFNQRISTLQQFVVKGKENSNDFAADGFSIDVELNIPAGQGVKSDAVALIIANRDYHNPDIPDVSYAHRDGEFVKQYLVRSLGYREGNIMLYKDATQSQFKTALQKLGNTAKDTAEVFFYYVGHGSPDPESKRGYFVPVDCDPNYVSVGGIALEDFYTELNKIKSSGTTVVIDACFSGASNEGMLIKNVSPVMIEIEQEHSVADNVVEFSSSSGDEVSSWYPDKKHSLYTYYFLKGLQGEADQNGDKILTVGEMQKYLGEKIPYEARRLNNRQQTPGVTPDRENRILMHYTTPESQP